MSGTFFAQNVVAIIWDFDRTLSPSYMQSPVFRRFGVDERQFWKEVNGLPGYYRARGLKNISADTIYLNHILTYVRRGIFKGLTNDVLFELGSEIDFYEGLPDFFTEIKMMVENSPEFAKHDISVEHYIVSTGLRKMIEGSRIAPYVDGIWACEFIEETAAPGYLRENVNAEVSASRSAEISDIAYAIDNTTKTRALFEINKGSNQFSQIDVNSTLDPADRRVPMQNMIYIADGPSDIPAFSIVKKYGGRAYAVYTPGNMDQFAQVDRLLQEGRVHCLGEANYSAGSQTSLWITHAVEHIASRIVKIRESILQDKVGAITRHILTDPGQKQLTHRPEPARETDSLIGSRDVVPESIRMERFGSLCKLALRRDYAVHETALLTTYEAALLQLDDDTFRAKMEEFERSIAGSPKGKLLKERQAVGSQNDKITKVRSFLNNLLLATDELEQR